MPKSPGLIIIALVLCCANPQLEAGEHPWFNADLPRQERITALLEAMTPAEKMQQLLNDAPGIPRLGIPPYEWWNEALHGVARNGRATVFPQAIGLAATFDEDLVRRVARAISDEARAKYNLARSLGNYGRYTGLTFWSPNINIFRDPRWGRGMETYGEDPYLTARIGVAFVQGLQGTDPDYLQAAACAKHFAVHSGPEALRHEFDAVASRKDFVETYLPAFEALVREAKVECVMCAYNRVYGEPACGSDLLLNDLLRDQWGFAGHVVSDCGAVRDFYQHHKVAGDAASASAWALKAGTDVNCGHAFDALPEALERGLVTEADLDRALARLLATRMKLGMFDTLVTKPWDHLGEETVERQEHVELAREAARRSIVLLKNRNGTLPLERNARRLFVAGPQASNHEVLMGNYHGLSSEAVSILEGIVRKVGAGTTVRYDYGVLPFRPNVNGRAGGGGAAASADATIAVLGISSLLEGEEGASVASATRGDRLELGLPENQLDFLRNLRGDHDRPIVVVLTGGSPMTIPEVGELADAIVWAWYPGQQGGNAVADVLFGDANPSGRLPVTFPRSVDQLPPFEDYGMRGRTYRYMTGEPLYPFGYGLTYTSFEYGEVRLSSATVKRGTALEVEVTVKNTGDRDGTEIVQLYLSSNDAGFEVPRSSLVGFRAVAIPAGEERAVRFTVAPEQMKVVNDAGDKVWVNGVHTLEVGGVSPGARGEALTGRPLRSADFTLL